MSADRQWIIEADKRRRLVSLVLVASLSVALGLVAFFDQHAWLPGSLYLLSFVLLISSLSTGLSQRFDSLRLQGSLLCAGIATVAQCWWASWHLPGAALLISAVFMLIGGVRAQLASLGFASLLLLVAVFQHGWWTAFKALTVPLGVLLVMSILQGQWEQALARWGASLSSDSLTGCGNIQSLHQEMVRQAELCQRYNVDATALVLRVDNWNAALETLGERRANDWLRELVSVWNSRMRNTDILCRCRDTQFVMLLPNTSANNAVRLEEDLLRASEVYEFRGGSQPSLTTWLQEFDPQEGVDEWLKCLSRDAGQGT